MPGITMCINKKCKKNKTCYRFMAQPNKDQSYCDFKPDEKGKCSNYWEYKDDFLTEPNRPNRLHWRGNERFK